MFDVIVAGGGAAGFYAAIHTAENNPNATIAIFERGKTVLSKVKVSGGGRCNVTHAEFNPRELVANYPRGEKEMLGPFHNYAPGEVVDFFERRKIPLKIEEDGRIFPVSNSSQTIIDCFVSEAERLGIRVLKNSPIKNFVFLKDEELWQVTTQNKHYQAKTLVLATGSNPKIWNQLKAMGHNIVEATPSLFTFNIKDIRLQDNQGISCNASVEVLSKMVHGSNAEKVRKTSKILGNLVTEGPVLITHWGLSGPAVLKLSAWGSKLLSLYDYNFKIKVNWQPDYSYESFLGLLNEVKAQEPKKTILRTRATPLPKRLWTSIAKAVGIDSNLTWADCSKEDLQRLASEITGGIFQVSGKSTFKEEFVTAGGVDLKEIDFKTFKSKKLPSLYFAGEIIDVDAITGGFNFQNAWTGAFITAQAISKELPNSIES